MNMVNQKLSMSIVTALAAAMLTTGGFAQVPPQPAPPAVVNADADQNGAAADAQPAVVAVPGNGVSWIGRSGKKEKATFLGVVSVAADAATRAQLKLPRGIGLVIKRVEDSTPAADAGLQENDLVTKMDDQWLVNQQQLGVLIRMHKPGDEITLTGLREGAPITIKAKLSEKEMVVADDMNMPWGVNNIDLSGLDQLKELENLKNLVPDEDDAAPLLIRDPDQVLKVSIKDNQRHLVATDSNGQILFDGPVETDEQRKALPNDLAEKLEKYKDQFNQVKEGNHQRIRIVNGR